MLDPHPGLTQELPSQPDIPAPDLVPGHLSDQSHAAAVQLGYHTFPESLQDFQQELHFTEAPMMVVPTAPPQQPSHDLAASGTQQAAPAKSRGGGSKSRATRRGPMDEMRQLVRILVKVIPHSGFLIASTDEGGGGNRISEEQIKGYLDSTLGEAPRPTWGVPGGWGEYLAGGLPIWYFSLPPHNAQLNCLSCRPLLGMLLPFQLCTFAWEAQIASMHDAVNSRYA